MEYIIDELVTSYAVVLDLLFAYTVILQVTAFDGMVGKACRRACWT